MAIRFECPECGKTLSVQDQLAGKKVKCPCGAVVTANPSGGTAMAAMAKPNPGPQRPGPATLPTKPASGGRPAAPAVRPANAAVRPAANAGSLQPQARTTTPAPHTAATNSDLGDLFDELTPTDLETRAQRTEAAANAPVKVDPLAAYRPDPKSRGRVKSSGPAIDRPLGLSILAGLAVLGILGSLAGAALYFGSPATLQSGPEPLDAKVIQFLGGMLIGAAVLSAVLVAALLTPQPWAWWFAILFYSSNVSISFINSCLLAQTGNAALGAGRAIGGLAVGAWILAYMYRQKTRDFYSIKLATWVGPAVSIPLGIAIGVGVILGTAAALVAVRG